LTSIKIAGGIQTSNAGASSAARDDTAAAGYAMLAPGLVLPDPAAVDAA
jgi:hypothetical protein